MNRFRTRRRAKDDSSAADQPSMPSFKGFRRGKKSIEEEPKKEIDLSSALPSDDNFRTSLLMTNLSARFSMLREQDDPNTKIGKASDDSVLYPKRQSRLADFGFTAGSGGLSDIAEVESIKAPFLRGQVDSYFSDDADSTKGGSIMNRGKPTEGNVLFGGRQKIYKIPAGPTRSNGASGMGGRALYDDDVALSAFQLWRQSENNKRSSGSKDTTTAGGQAVEEAEPLRSESPLFPGYNRKRETSSTTSSASLVARYSTAATSVTSQPSTSTRESQPASTAASSATSTPALERSVTRTRRLYEQALTQDMQDQQSSAFSRLDTLGRQRLMGSRTPDLAQVTPSATPLAFQERFGERRSILAKSSAPNLRSFSPTATTPSTSGTPDLGSKAQTLPENRAAFGGSPPLSPPISETGDHALLPIQPKDRGKATAMGVFQKPAEPYDESKYAQRQLQLQSGRDSPSSRMRTGSSASHAASWRSRSSSSMQRQPLEGKAESSRPTEPTVKEEYGNGGTFLDDSDDSPSLDSPAQSTTPQVVLQRPRDSDHPAFRERALPTPLSMDEVTMAETSELRENTASGAASPRDRSPPDSPTLGPTSGLSGMVRQHLRSESNASSVYGIAPQPAGPDEQSYTDVHDSIVEGLGAKSNPWTFHGQEWKASDSSRPGAGDVDDGNASEDADTDAFASQLADARRRVRERLTSYADTDSSRECSPSRPAEPGKDTVGPGSSANALGIGMLKPKSSGGSLADRSRDRSRAVGKPRSKAKIMLGIGAATMATSPSPSRPSFDELGSPRPSVDREGIAQDRREDQPKMSIDVDSETDSKVPKEKDDDNMHPGLRAFRQARRELQRRKELETLARHQASQVSSGTTQPTEVPREQTNFVKESTARQRTPSRDRKPPPVAYQQRASTDDSGYRRGRGSQPTSRQTSTDRDGSASEAGHGRSDGRPGRLRNDSATYDAFQHQPQLGPRKIPHETMQRSPGLPGTDIRRSPFLPPQNYPASSTSSAVSSPQPVDRSHSSTKLTPNSIRPGHETHLGQPSPVSPLGGTPELPEPSSAPAAGSTVTLPTSSVSQTRRPSEPRSPTFSTTTSATKDSRRRTVNKQDISEPTFIMSTTRVPTVSIPQPAPSPNGTREQANTGTTGQDAPPLPPINPRRKREESVTKDVVGDTTSSAPIAGPASGTTGSESTGRRRVGTALKESFKNILPDHNRADGEASRGPNFGFGSRQQGSNAIVPAGPPASRTVLTPKSKSSNTGVPGGMF